MSALVELQKKCGVTPDGVWGPATFNAACRFFGMTKVRGAHFFGNCYHETGGFTRFIENLNYSADGLMSTFKKYFPTFQSTTGYARNPEKIANRVYANRMANGSEASGDGWKYRGRGAIQLTGAENYRMFSQEMKDPEILTNPGIVAEKYAFESAVFFFNRNHIFAICDKGITDNAILLVTKKVNGGTNGLDERSAKTKQFATW